MGIRRSPGVTYEPSGDRVVILDGEGTVMTTLNPVGTVIWKALDGRDTATLATDLAPEFDGVDPVTLRDDIEAFVAELAESNLVEID